MDKALWTKVEEYVAGVVAPSDAVLDAATEAGVRAGLPSIAITPTEGKFLSLLARLVGAQKILEVGTLAGYSTIWMARALSPGGRLITLEVDPKHADVARSNFSLAKLHTVIDVRVGKALETLPKLEHEKAGPFDLVFIDADKQSNADYFSWAIKLARPGAVIVVDNVIRDGKVADADSTDPNILGVRRLNDLLRTEKRVSATTIQTVGSKGYDGFTLAVVE